MEPKNKPLPSKRRTGQQGTPQHKHPRNEKNPFKKIPFKVQLSSQDVHSQKGLGSVP